MYKVKPEFRRVTVNLPAALLESAHQVTGKNITETFIEGLERVKRSAAASKAKTLKGMLHLDIDLEVSRERSGH